MRAPLEGAGVEEFRVVAPGRRRAGLGGGVVGIGRRAFKRAHQDRGVSHGPRHRAGRVVIGGNRNHAVAADAADRRSNADQHVRVRRTDHRTARIGTDARGPQISGRADPGARSAGLENRPSIAVVARIRTRIVRVEAEAADTVVVAGHRIGCAGDPVGQFGQPGLRHDDRAGVTQILGERRFVRRNISGKRQRAASRRQMRGVDVVFERHGDPV